MDLDLLVIGDSSAGWHGAVTAAQLGHKVGLIVRSEALNSDLRQIPDDVTAEVCADWPLHQTGRHAAAQITSPDAWGKFTQYAKSAWQYEIDLYCAQFLNAGGQIWAGTAALTDAHSATVSSSGSLSRELHAEQILIATGTEFRRPQFAKVPLRQVFDAAQLLDVGTLPREASVIGAGVTGLRAACLLAWWGVKVRVIDGRSQVSLQDDSETSGLINRANELGVRFLTGEDVIGLESEGRRVEIVMESGRRLQTESVWLATGRYGRTDELQLENAELSADDCGRLWCGVDLRTWTESICAAGDVVGYTPEVGSEKELVSQAVQALLTPSVV